MSGSDNPSPRANASLFGCLHQILEVYTAKIDDIFSMYNLSCFNNSSDSGNIFSVCNTIHDFTERVELCLHVELWGGGELVSDRGWVHGELINILQGSSFIVWPSASINHYFPKLYIKTVHLLPVINMITFFLLRSIVGRDVSWIQVVTVPEAVSDNIVTHSAPCLKSPHYACTIYKGDICPEGR